jgi:GxxExxY protein
VSDHAPLDPKLNAIGRAIYDAAFEVHRQLGPGLLESVYKACLAKELALRGMSVRMEVPVPLIYRDMHLETGFRIDMLVNELVVLEAKGVEAIHPVHEAQLLTYLKLSDRRLGYLINFNVPLIKDGIRRFVL